MLLLEWCLCVNSRQSATPIFYTRQRPQLTAIASAEPIPPHYIFLALCLLARPSQSVFRVQCLCVSPPSDLRLQRTTTPRRVRRPSFGLPRLAISHTLSASSAAPAALLDSAWHRLLLHREPGAIVVVLVVVVLPSTRTTHLRTYNTRGSYDAQQASSKSRQTRLHSQTRRRTAMRF